MNMQQAFLDDIIAHTSDDTPRLVYADWLDENGQPERGEFIRLQCELAKLPGNDKRQLAMREREQALLKTYRAAWTKVVNLPRSVFQGNDKTCVFRRGFVSEISINAADFIKHASKLLRSFPLEGIRLGNAFDYVAALTESPHLANLTLLDLSHQGIGAKGVKALVGSPHLASLTSLDLSYNLIGGEGARAIARSPHLANLISLRLRIGDFGPRGKQFIGAKGARAIAESVHLVNLASLDLSGQDIRDEGARAIAASHNMARLTSLDLSENDIGDEGAQAIAESRHLTELRDLALTRNCIGDEGAQAIAESQHMRRLESLDFERNQIGKYGAIELAHIFSSRGNLAYLGLAENSFYLDGDLEAALKQRLGEVVNFYTKDEHGFRI